MEDIELPENMPAELKSLIRKAISANKSVVEREIPMRAEWALAVKKWRNTCKEAKLAENIAKHNRQAMWTLIEADTKLYGQMRINHEKNVIEVMQEND